MTELYTDWRRVPDSARGAIAALGNFDGVHLGHAHLLRTLHAARPDARLGVVTFEPHPRELFRPEDAPFRLSLPEERRAALAAIGVQSIFEIRFDAEFSHFAADRFLREVLHQALDLRHLACGPDFAFGYRRGGDVASLAEQAAPLGIGLTVVPPLADTGGPLSSSRIRRALLDGYPERATEELGRPWAVRGIVEHGDKRGRLLGFPTANLRLGRHLEPARGVYAATVRLPDGETRPGVANIGRRPTVSSAPQSLLEVHLFDHAGDLYGQELSVALHTLLRSERKFDGIEALTAQIANDAAEAREYLLRKLGG